ncbi:MAG: microviridin/marinostatin family tricyclic proteinase inhibitor [Leptolyngbya sp. SIO1E4]|nr:microviridin/marinostatin family tricyclic proteinase inhibitor [Leptolyngbya sp. SIO1E4]
MTAHKDYYSNSQAIPFFARYLEGQSVQDLSEEDLKNISGGNGSGTTNKHPSDADEEHTTKYPSDGDDFSDIVA